MKKKLKYIVLICLGVLCSVIVIEIIMRAIKAPMLFDRAKHCNFNTSIFEKSTDSTDFFNYLYVDVYDNYFELKNNIYIIKRVNPFLMDSKKNQIFTKIKKPDIARIFIAGESVAELFPAEILQKNLKRYIPDKEFEIINAGTGSYESYRVKRIVKEILKHQPDFIILFIGNNDGIFEPVEINYLPYKYKIFRTSYILNRLSHWFVKKCYFNGEECMSFFQKNIISIVKLAENKSKIIFVTLPRNSIQLASEFEYNYPDSEEYTNNMEQYVKRRKFLRSLAYKYPWVSTADYDYVLKKNNGHYSGYDVFCDAEHYWGNMYDLISKLIVEQISGVCINVNPDYFSDLIKENENEIEKYNLENDEADNDRYYAILCYILKKLYVSNNKLFKEDMDKAFGNNRKIFINAAIYTLIRFNEQKKALIYLDQFLQKNPDNYIGYLLKALAYYKSGNRKLAEECFYKAKNINPKNKFNLEYLDKFYKNKKFNIIR